VEPGHAGDTRKKQRAVFEDFAMARASAAAMLCYGAAACACGAAAAERVMRA